MARDPKDNSRRSIHDAAQRLADIDPGFSIRDSEHSDPDRDPLADPKAKRDPEAKRRRTVSRDKQTEGLRPVLIRKAYRVFMKRLPKHRRNPEEVVRLIMQSWATKPPYGFGIQISRTTVYRALRGDKGK